MTTSELETNFQTVVSMQASLATLILVWLVLIKLLHIRHVPRETITKRRAVLLKAVIATAELIVPLLALVLMAAALQLLSGQYLNYSKEQIQTGMEQQLGPLIFASPILAFIVYFLAYLIRSQGWKIRPRQRNAATTEKAGN